ncbi:MAG: hypothetical protein ACE5JU_15655 [Candidatus Binatia bacterium]
MKEIVEFVNKRVEEQHQNPFMQWLDNESIPPKVRLSKWLLGAGFFVLGFKDLNTMILGYPQSEAATDPIKKAINAHTEEDSTHWGWYLNDIQQLGLDKQMKFTDSVRFLWGEPLKKQRLATYRICQLAEKSKDPILRYCLIKSVEGFGEFIFGKMAKISAEFAKESGIELEYLGETHSIKESGGLASQPDETEDMILDMELDKKTRELGLDIAKETCDLIEGRWIEFYEYVTQHLDG